MERRTPVRRDSRLTDRQRRAELEFGASVHGKFRCFGVETLLLPRMGRMSLSEQSRSDSVMAAVGFVCVYRAYPESARSAGFIPQERRPCRSAPGNLKSLPPINLPAD